MIDTQTLRIVKHKDSDLVIFYRDAGTVRATDSMGNDSGAFAVRGLAFRAGKWTPGFHQFRLASFDPVQFEFSDDAQLQWVLAGVALGERTPMKHTGSISTVQATKLDPHALIVWQAWPSWRGDAFAKECRKILPGDVAADSIRDQWPSVNSESVLKHLRRMGLPAPKSS